MCSSGGIARVSRVTSQPATPAPDMARLRLDIAYDGSGFHGWARQRPAPDGSATRTVQETLETALALVLRTEVGLTVAGRTDAGVHASGQVAHVDVPRVSLQQRSIDGDPGRLVRRLAKLLPEDIRVFAVTEVPPLFDARFSALERTYAYRVTTHPGGALPMRRSDTATWGKPVDLARMQNAADLLLGLNDFAAFCRARPHATTVRQLRHLRWAEASTSEEPELYIARVTADAFCWNMVRALVATCLIVGEGRRDEDWVSTLLTLRERSAQVPLAPARGLTLTGVAYPPEQDLAARSAQTRARRGSIG